MLRLTGRRTSSLLGCHYPLATGKPEIGGEGRNVIEKVKHIFYHRTVAGAGAPTSTQHNTPYISDGTNENCLN